MRNLNERCGASGSHRDDGLLLCLVATKLECGHRYVTHRETIFLRAPRQMRIVKRGNAAKGILRPKGRGLDRALRTRA